MPPLFPAAGAGPGGAPPSGRTLGPGRPFPPSPARDAAPGQRCGDPRPGPGERRPRGGAETRGEGSGAGARGSPGRARGCSRRGGRRRGWGQEEGPGGAERGVPGGPSGAGPALRKPRSAASSRRRRGNSRLPAGLSPPLATPGLSLPAPAAPGAAAGGEMPGILPVPCLHRRRAGDAPHRGQQRRTNRGTCAGGGRNFPSKDLRETQIFGRQNPYH